jgi:hypothetical protein
MDILALGIAKRLQPAQHSPRKRVVRRIVTGARWRNEQSYLRNALWLLSLDDGRHYYGA